MPKLVSPAETASVWRRLVVRLLCVAFVLSCGYDNAGSEEINQEELLDLTERVRLLEQSSEPRLPPEAVPLESASTPEPESSLAIGGALRLNYAWRDYSEPDKDKAGDFGFELFRLDIDGEYGKLGLSVQYRWYAPFEAIHHGYISYELFPQWQAQLGIHQVPFGILPYASHSFWFGATYYLGLEDDYDTGLKLIYDEGPWNLQMAFYKNPEYVDSSRADRYSFDLVTSGDQANEETNQLNIRLAREFQVNSCLSCNVGASVEGGQIYNGITQAMGDHFAYALHDNLIYGDWGLQLQWIEYEFHPENPPGVDPNTVQLAAFQFPFLVASEGRVATVNVARTFATKHPLADTVTCYADFSKVYPTTDDSHSSTQLVLGTLFAVEDHLFVYVDWIFGQNMWFAGGPGIGLNQADADEWQTRLNVNCGFYF